MFTHAMLMYLYVETPLHAGSGRGLGAVDLPIQRERATGYPMVQAPGLKGKLRAEAYHWKPFLEKYTQYLQQEKDKLSPEDKAKESAVRGAEKRARRAAAQELGLEVVFGPETDGASEHAGAISPGDARLLLLPVRSLAGVFAWTTSANALARFMRDYKAARPATDPGLNWNIPNIGEGTALVASENDVTAGGSVVLEEFSYTPQPNAVVQTIGGWLAQNALPQGDEYKYWREKLPRSLVILPENDFRDFALYATEVATRVRLDNVSKTVESSALWTEESLPADTLLYAPLFASRSRNSKPMTGEQVLNVVTGLGLDRAQLGGDETVGRGIVALRFGEVQHV